MKTTDILILLGLGGLVYYFAQLNTAAGTANFVLGIPSFITPTKVNIPISVQNVSNAEVKLNALTANVAINGNPIGTASTFVQTVIEPTSQQLVNLTLDLSVLSLPTTILSLFNQTGNTYNFTVNGNANVNSLVLPFNLTQSVTI
jgi:hypothetical protein